MSALDTVGQASASIPATDDLRARAQRVADIARLHADDVDRAGRFPQEAWSAAAHERLLGLLVSPEEGGEGASVSAVAEVTETLARGCASTGLIFAMHQNQIAGLVRHGGPQFEQVRRELADRQLLVASATTEIGIGGDIRRSTCAVEPGADGSFTLVKNAPVISYAEYADAVVVTARKDPDAAPSDQVLVYAPKSKLTLERTSEWNTLGFRGTCSPGYVITTHNSTDAILPLPFAEISARTMLPCTHIFWSSAWLGIATESVSVARTFVQRLARRTPGTLPPSALRLAELQIALQTFTSSVHDAARTMDAMRPDSPDLDSVGFAVAMNGLKVSSANAVVDIVSRAMVIVGIAGYRLDSEFSLGRQMRDAIGSQLMVNNDRILAATSSLELVNRSTP